MHLELYSSNYFSIEQLLKYSPSILIENVSVSVTIIVCIFAYLQKALFFDVTCRMNTLFQIILMQLFPMMLTFFYEYYEYTRKYHFLRCFFCVFLLPFYRHFFLLQVFLFKHFLKGNFLCFATSGLITLNGKEYLITCLSLSIN